MYAVAYFNASGAQPCGIFPNVFPDIDMARDCVIYQIKADYNQEVSTAELESAVQAELGGTTIYHWEDTVYVIGKLFNFNPKGM
jgi:hypothetical protein